MNNPEHDPIMAIQINCFHYERIAITLCASHKLGNISTLINFVNDWAAITNHHQDQNHPLPSPSLLDIRMSIFSQGDLSVYQEKPYFGLPKSVYKRFVFEASKIEALKATVAPIHLTRFEAVEALICKCTTSALGLSPNSSLLSTIAVNLCKKMDPPVPNKTLGNMIIFFIFGSGGAGSGSGGSGVGGG
ncbi:salutaridinol 7-O-acetyltransferase-like [Arachis ipaensis]|uniref:Uncharacterized protein n=2 Tax=Arachis hypogaea TaxID=3818 RepID=A0A444X7Y8_ARAHY|nr:salutaridinol 7-O-acetyltransferase-like [Arachis ipaensis]XP_025685529.1 salutaridinol 7-O-acetyltransferase-like [Arachis hypogaea]RYQ85653.1 hypothetical protein Ahy_B10g105230 isoform A [Arachis hypogaea]